MNTASVSGLADIVERHGRSRTALMDILRDIQKEQRHVSPQAMTYLARELDIPRVEVASFVSFYAFLSDVPLGHMVIRVCDDVVDRMKGFQRVLDAFRRALGVDPGGTTPDGEFTLATTACIGLCDQAPAALINDVPVTELSTDKVDEILQELKVHRDPARLVRTLGDGNNAHPLVHSMVKNNIVEAGPLVFAPEHRAEALRKAVSVSPREVIRSVKAARLRGRGGAGFPTGMKWEFARSAPDGQRYIFCNADEGEPGTFKDRVILTERADRVFAGMTIAGYAIGAAEGILYLRGEYAYLRPFLEERLRLRRADGLLGEKVSGKKGFDFDIRIQMGAGAYVCGEESALINSCEGMRGDPRNRPPFPAQRGYLGYPTVVNNVETLACVARILEDGPATFAEYGTPQSAGTKLFSVSGDCFRPGIYELPWGISLGELLDRVGGADAQAVQVGGPSGRLVAPSDFGRKLCFDDLATGGAIVVFGQRRNLLEVVRQYQAFFAEESCGYCVPCRVGNEILMRYLDRLLDGRAEPTDIDGMIRVARTMKTASRCGLGQTACNPVLTSLESAKHLYDAAVSEHPEGFRRSFDLDAATATAKSIRDRWPAAAHADRGA